MPDLPRGSSADPALYQTMWVTTGALRSGITTTFMPFSSLAWVTWGGAKANASLLAASAGGPLSKVSANIAMISRVVVTRFVAFGRAGMRIQIIPGCI